MGVDGLRRRIGSVSQTAGMLYWSTTRKRWQTLILDAHAVLAPDQDHSRADFTLEEIAGGRTLFFHQKDNTFGQMTYRMYIRDCSAQRLVCEVENISTIRYLIGLVLHPREIQSLYYFNQDSANVWRYYAITRTNGGIGTLLKGREASIINRAVASYRHIVGIPTDQEPPAAP
jgi:hypothetical protein